MIKKPLTITISLLIFILAGLIIIWGWYHFTKRDSQPNNQATRVIVTHPTQHETQNRLNVPGHLIAYNATWVTSHTPGFIKAILFHEGDFVEQGQPLILLDPTKIKAKLQADAAQLNASQNKYAIEQGLHEKGIISTPKLQQQHAQKAQNQAQLQKDEATLKEMIIRAPFTGYLGSKKVNIGQHIDTSKHLVHLVDRHNLQVKYHIPAEHVSAVQLGQIVAIKGDRHTFKGQINFIAPNIDPETGTVEIHAQVNNDDNQHWPGQFVKVQQPTSAPKSHTVIPEQTVLSNLGGHYVFIVHNHKAKKQKVKLGDDLGGCIVIQEGLDPDDNLIIAGEHQVHDDEPIKIDQHKQVDICNS